MSETSTSGRSSAGWRSLAASLVFRQSPFIDGGFLHEMNVGLLINQQRRQVKVPALERDLQRRLAVVLLGWRGGAGIHQRRFSRKKSSSRVVVVFANCGDQRFDVLLHGTSQIMPELSQRSISQVEV